MMQIESYALSRRGEVREINQDSIFLSSYGQYAIFLVADGVGGLLEGEKASQTIRDRLIEWWYFILPKMDTVSMDYLKEDLCRILQKINTDMFELSEKVGYSASTVVILLIFKNQYLVINIGDSRCYYIPTDTSDVLCLSIDDVWENLEEVKLNIKDIANHRNYGKLTQAIGGFRTIKPNIKEGSVQLNDVFFLCSDGIYKMCDEDFLYSELIRFSQNELSESCMETIEKNVLKNGSFDNYSAIVVKTVSSNDTKLS